MISRYFYSGSLPEENSTYIKRKADDKLYEELKAGELCMVLSSSQSGKSSLRVRTMCRLREDGVKYASIDLSGGGIESVSSQEQWYKNLVNTLITSLELDVKEEWWEQNQSDSVVVRFRKFLEKILLAKVKKDIVIFIDEIGTVLSLNFSTDDFFNFIRFCYQQRVDNPDYKRLTFCLLGIASPGNLIQDLNSTPFNIGKTIFLPPFQPGEEIEPLIKGLRQRYSNSKVVIEEILKWTGGQPFLTQKLCDFMMEESHEENPRTIEQVVCERIIENWEFQDEPQHLRTIRNRILKNEQLAYVLLKLYGRILHKDGIAANNTIEQYELQLSGLVVREKNELRVYNRIYKNIFDIDWIETQLSNLFPYAEDFKNWVASGCKDKSYLLRKKKLEESEKWAEHKSLSDLHSQFLLASKNQEQGEKLAILEIESKIERERKDKEAAEKRNKNLAEANYTLNKANRRIRVGNSILVLTLLAAVISGSFAVVRLTRIEKQTKNLSVLSHLSGELQSNHKQEEADEARRQLGLSHDNEIKKRYELQQMLLSSNIALAHHNLGNQQEAETAMEDSIKLSGSQNSSLEKEALIYVLNIKGKIYQNQNHQIATAAYEKAFDLLQSNSDHFYPLDSKTKIITFDTIQSMHRELIKLLNTEPSQSNDLLSKVRKSLQKYFYTELENRLENKDWKEADQITSEIIWELAGTSQERSFRAEVSRKFPCEDLRTIDALWRGYSNGHFGFSVQRSIWQSSQVNKNLIKFINYVGWGKLRKQEDGPSIVYFFRVKDFSLNAPKGQLPWLVAWEGSDGLRDRRAYLSRIVSCGI